MFVELSTLVERVVEFMVVVPPSRTVVDVVLVLVLFVIVLLVVISVPVVPTSTPVVFSCAIASDVVVLVNPTIAIDEAIHAPINK
jgi:hypothetical protein